MAARTKSPEHIGEVARVNIIGHPVDLEKPILITPEAQPSFYPVLAIEVDEPQRSQRAQRKGMTEEMSSECLEFSVLSVPSVVFTLFNRLLYIVACSLD